MSTTMVMMECGGLAGDDEVCNDDDEVCNDDDDEYEDDDDDDDDHRCECCVKKYKKLCE